MPINYIVAHTALLISPSHAIRSLDLALLDLHSFAFDKKLSIARLNVPVSMQIGVAPALVFLRK
jgi:hypothetical protein